MGDPSGENTALLTAAVWPWSMARVLPVAAYHIRLRVWCCTKLLPAKPFGTISGLPTRCPVSANTIPVVSKAQSERPIATCVITQDRDPRWAAQNCVVVESTLAVGKGTPRESIELLVEQTEQTIAGPFVDWVKLIQTPGLVDREGT
jgi:hypothetical protein